MCVRGSVLRNVRADQPVNESTAEYVHHCTPQRQIEVLNSRIESDNPAQTADADEQVLTLAELIREENTLITPPNERFYASRR